MWSGASSCAVSSNLLLLQLLLQIRTYLRKCMNMPTCSLDIWLIKGDETNWASPFDYLLHLFNLMDTEVTLQKSKWHISKKWISSRLSGIWWEANLTLLIWQVPYSNFPVILRHVLVPKTSSLLPLVSETSLKWLQEITKNCTLWSSSHSDQFSWRPYSSQQTVVCIWLSWRWTAFLF